MAQWFEQRTRYRKVSGSSSGRSSRRIFFSRVNFLYWLLFRYQFHPRVTAVTHKRSRPFYQKCRWQVTDKHTCILHVTMWFRITWSDTVNWCMVVWCTQNLRRDGSSFTWHQPCNNQTALWPPWWILKTRCVKLPSLIQSHWHTAKVQSQRIAIVSEALGTRLIIRSPTRVCNRTCGPFLVLGSGGGWRLPRRDTHNGIHNCL